MTQWQSFLLWLYCHGSAPWRRARLARMVAERRVPIMVIAHHRIADHSPNSWSCSNAVFIAQMRWLADHGEFITLAEVQRRIREGNDRPAFSLTFDDGYAENLDQAFPFLLRENIPFTCFITTQNAFTGEPFRHDVERGTPCRPLSVAEIKSLAAAGVEIAAHTRTHPDLAGIRDPQRLHDEIVTAGQDLAKAAGCRVRYFAFTFGQRANLSREAFRIARDSGYEAACSCYGGYNFPGDDPFHLQREGGPSNLVRIVNSATIDPRKLRTSRYELEG